MPERAAGGEWPHAGRYIAMMANFVRWGTSLGLLASVALMGCMDQDTPKKVARVFQAGSDTPDESPKMLNEDLPFDDLIDTVRMYGREVFPAVLHS